MENESAVAIVPIFDCYLSVQNSIS